MRLRRLRRQCGCTLTEALVTLAILSFGVTGIVQLQLDLLRATGQGKARTEALALALGQLEQLRAITRPEPYDTGSDHELDLVGSNGRFDLHWNIGTTSGAATYEVRTSVQWLDARGEKREVRLDTLLPATDPAWAARTLE